MGQVLDLPQFVFGNYFNNVKLVLNRTLSRPERSVGRIEGCDFGLVDLLSLSLSLSLQELL